MRLLERLANKFTKSASITAKKEVKKTIVDLIPGVLAIGTMILGIVIFHETESVDEPYHVTSSKPYSSTTKITTNNYFLGDVSDEIIKKVLEASDND